MTSVTGIHKTDYNHAVPPRVAPVSLRWLGSSHAIEPRSATPQPPPLSPGAPQPAACVLPQPAACVLPPPTASAQHGASRGGEPPPLAQPPCIHTKACNSGTVLQGAWLLLTVV